MANQDVLNSEDWLREKYVRESWSSRDIANFVDRSHHYVNKKLREHGISVRGKGDLKDYYERPDEVEDESELRRMYVDEGMSTYEIADEIDCSQNLVSKKLREHGIETRDNKGENNPNFKHGNSKSIRYGPSWKSTREEILERDGHECRVCSSGDLVDVHHIRPAEEFEEGDGYNWEEANDSENLASLCRSCHVEFEGMHKDCSHDEFVTKVEE